MAAEIFWNLAKHTVQMPDSMYSHGILWEDSATRNLHSEYLHACVLIVNLPKLSN